MIDEIDKKILTILQENARTSNAEIARQVALAPSAVFERVKKLEERGIVTGYSARVDARVLGQGILAFVFVKSSETFAGTRTSAQLAKIPEIQEVHHIVGEDCFIVKVRAVDTLDLARILRDRIGSIKSVSSTRTTIVLETIKETSEVSLERTDGNTTGA